VYELGRAEFPPGIVVVVVVVDVDVGRGGYHHRVSRI
jgi:hypothetical protein